MGAISMAVRLCYPLSVFSDCTYSIPQGSIGRAHGNRPGYGFAPIRSFIRLFGIAYAEHGFLAVYDSESVVTNRILGPSDHVSGVPG